MNGKSIPKPEEILPDKCRLYAAGEAENQRIEWAGSDLRAVFSGATH